MNTKARSKQLDKQTFSLVAVVLVIALVGIVALLVPPGTPRVLGQPGDPKKDADDCAEIKRSIPYAVSVPRAFIQGMAGGLGLPKLPELEYASLSALVMLTLFPLKENEAAKREFQYLGDYWTKRSASKMGVWVRALHKEASRPFPGSVSLTFGQLLSIIHPDRITSFTCEVKGDRANGRISFHVPDICRGSFEYEAKRQVGGWKIVRLLFPANGFELEQAEGERWRYKELKEGTPKGGTEEESTGEKIEIAHRSHLFPPGTSIGISMSFAEVVNLPGIRDYVEALLELKPIAQFLEDAGVDPKADLLSVWIVACDLDPMIGDAKASKSGPQITIPSPEKAEVLAIVESKVEEAKLVAALKKRSLISVPPGVAARKMVYNVPLDPRRTISMTFLSKDTMMLGTSSLFNKALDLSREEETIRGFTLFRRVLWDPAVGGSRSMSSSQSAPPDQAGKRPGPSDGREGRKYPVALLSIDRSPNKSGLLVDLAVTCKPSDEALQAEKHITSLLEQLKGHAPQALQPDLGRVGTEVWSVVRTSLRLPKETLEKLAPKPRAGTTR